MRAVLGNQWARSPRFIQIPLSDDDRKAQAKGLRASHGLHDSYLAQSQLILSAPAEKLREADRLECEAWNAIIWSGGPAMPTPGEPRPTRPSPWRSTPAST
ncbi:MULTISPECIES: hypothetical protein [unclassified Bradyrhizobium]|uniref:hypothetical protein n=1 Tax=unclassified Bradyrhizobium TaxID=2631580 RepID=UPI0028EE0BDB|nr:MULTISPECIES: hypothetical protein [unclassified Bradyrhizobium]